MEVRGTHQNSCLWRFYWTLIQDERGRQSYEHAFHYDVRSVHLTSEKPHAVQHLVAVVDPWQIAHRISALRGRVQERGYHQIRVACVTLEGHLRQLKLKEHK